MKKLINMNLEELKEAIIRKNAATEIIFLYFFITTLNIAGFARSILNQKIIIALSGATGRIDLNRFMNVFSIFKEGFKDKERI